MDNPQPMSADYLSTFFGIEPAEIHKHTAPTDAWTEAVLIFYLRLALREHYLGAGGGGGAI